MQNPLLRLAPIVCNRTKQLIAFALVIFFYVFSACTDNKTSKSPEIPSPHVRVNSLLSENNQVLSDQTNEAQHDILFPDGTPVLTGKPFTINPLAIPSNSQKLVTANPRNRVRAYPNQKNAVNPTFFSNLSWSKTTNEPLPDDFIQTLTAEIISKFEISGQSQTINWIQKNTRFPKPVPAGDPISREQASFDIRSLDVEQGMASSYVNAMALDQTGALWIGTGGGGLSRYNGNSFVHFTEETGLSKNYILCLQFDKDGNLWFGTNGGGLGKFDGKNFYYLNTDNGLLSNTILSLYLDEKNAVWCGTESGGLAKISENTLTNFTPLNGFPAQSVWAINSNSDGNIYAGTDQGIFKFDGTSFYFLEETKNIPVLCLSRNGNNEIAAGTRTNGILLLKNNSIYTLNTNNGLPSDYIVSLAAPESETLYIGTEEDGLVIYKKDKLYIYREKEGLTSSYISCILSDSKQRIWMGTFRGGINLFSPNSFNHYSSETGLSKSVVQSIAQGAGNSLWLGTNGEGLFQYNGREFIQYNEAGGFPSNFINAAIKDRNGNLWFGTEYGGLIRYKNGSFFQISREQGLNAEIIISLSEDKNGDIWIGTDGDGLFKFNGNEFYQYSTNQGLPNDIIPALQSDKSGNLWIGTNGGGLIKFDGNEFICFSPKEGLPSTFISTLKIDKTNLLWIGTEGAGIWAFDGKEFMGITEYEGLTHNTIWSITEDNSNRLWIATEMGINVILRDSTLPNPQISRMLTLRSQSGLKGLDFYPNAAYLDNQNIIWWGTGKALTSLNLNKYQFNNTPQSVSISQIEINEKYYDFNLESEKTNGIRFNQTAPFSNIPTSLVLAHNLNHLSFHFSPNQWIAPERLWYSYYLDGIDNDWSSPTQRSIADYRNIPAGKYTLWVKALNDGNEWGEAAFITFEILPPWWLTWWAKIIYFTLLVIAIIQIFRWRTAALLKRQEELERLVNERTYELKKEKQEVEKQRDEVEKQRKVSEELLLNILPAEIAQELKAKGSSDAKLINEATVLFTDFKGFTEMSETLSPKELVSDINECFSAFDKIIEKHGVEKIKTIGDAYMAAGGLPSPNTTHARDVLNAALEIQDFMANLKKQRSAEGKHYFEIRIGIHTGSVVAGIVGIRKFQYDIWGDTVNTASRMESSSEIGKTNVSETTYNLVKDEYIFEHRGKLDVKGKGEMMMFFLKGKI
jgi:ligand-binding sensor domain-containing protein/class 3 adenylate cyclase